MIQWSKGGGMDLHRPLKPVIKRSVTHYDKNHPYRHWLCVLSVAAGSE